MKSKTFLEQLNIFAQCRSYNLSLWQCPQFLFVLMGIVICISSIAVFMIGTRYISDPTIVALIVLAAAALLFILAFLITKSFEGLAEANRMKSEFISVVSHQLRSPISNLSWALDLLMSGRLGKIGNKQTEYFKILKDNIARMKKLVSDLLIVSRIQTATLPLKKQEFFLKDKADRLLAEFRSFALASNVKLALRTEENLPMIFADPSQIEQVIKNLLDNAIRYVKGGGRVDIWLKKKKNAVYFEISDTGVGIPVSDQKFIFQKFFRSKNILKHQTRGSGLGLFIAKSIIEKSGGEIGFKSKEGKGTTFWFTLPIKTI